ncbi:hypothetical protein MC885_017219, partial [Smutsia gigantea]
ASAPKVPLSLDVPLFTGLAPLAAFNVDVAWTWLTPEDGAPYVLSSLLHHDPSTNQTWLLVTSPRSNRTAAPLHRCSLSQEEIQCQPVEHVPIPKGRHRGVTVVRNHHGILICIQVLARRPHSLSSELTGSCSLLAPNFHPQAQVYFFNLEQILDPRAHMDVEDCHRNEKHGTENTSRGRRALEAEEEEEDEEETAGTEIAICNFALVQYGEVIQTEFDLRDSQDVMASLNRVQDVIQVGKVTKTASAIQHVLDNIFTPSRGSRKKANKVIVVLTDGDTFGDPLNLTTVINSPKMRNVERFAIGVGDAFKNAKTDRELKMIASDPDETHAFTVTNYTALDGLLSKLQQSIIHMEGTSGDALHYQLAQIGFSAQILDEGQVLLGAVGAFNWAGGALLYDTQICQGRFLNQTRAKAETAQYSYLGYTVAVLHKASGLSYVAGAPRHKHRGTMGSYFGSELCPVDIDMDGTTDFLLVAAPFYHIHGQEGRVYMYRLNEQRIRASAVAPGLRFFGMSVAGGLDFSGDDLADITVGTLGQAAVLRVNVCLCFEISSMMTAAESGLREMSLNFTVDVDVGKQRKRLRCADTRACQSHLSGWGSGSHLCEPLLLMPTEGELCEEDCFSNISVKVSYQLQGPEGRRDHPHPLPYEKACKNKLFCVAELHLATTTSQKDLVVGVTKELTMNISLTNSGEDSYMTSMALNYPRNLQFKSIRKCDDPKPTASVLVMNCRIGHPILKRSSANFSVVWQLEENAFPNRTASITVTVTNSNERRSLVTETHSLQFRWAFMAVLPKPSVMYVYVNTSRGVSDHKEFFFNIHGENLFGAKFQLQICVPIKLQDIQFIKVKSLTKTQARTVCAQRQESACGTDPGQHVDIWHLVSCAITADKENITVAAELSLSQYKQLRDVTEVQILGEISFNKSLYEGLNAENHRTKITVFFLKDTEYSLLLIMASSVGGLLVLILIVVLLFKCGFFKRKYQQLNLESLRKAQLKSENLLLEENEDQLPHVGREHQPVVGLPEN